MKTPDWIGAIFILILVYLVVVNASGTNKVINAAGGQLNNLVTSLQGRS